MVNAFEDSDGQYLALVNDEGQYSIWPHFIEVPAGWKSVYGPVSRQECVEYIDSTWTDMRPNSLIRAMQEHS